MFDSGSLAESDPYVLGGSDRFSIPNVSLGVCISVASQRSVSVNTKAFFVIV